MENEEIDQESLINITENLEEVLEEVRSHEFVDNEKPIFSEQEITIYPIDKNRVKLKWDKASDNTGIKSYKLYLDEELIETTDNLELTFNYPSEKDNVQNKIIAVDLNDNESGVRLANIEKMKPYIHNELEKAKINISYLEDGVLVSWSKVDGADIYLIY